jgi:hypothetical protein
VSDYKKTTEFLINYIKKSFEFGNDIAIALKELRDANTDAWQPSMQISINTDFAVSKLENRQFKIELKADYDGY